MTKPCKTCQIELSQSEDITLAPEKPYISWHTAETIPANRYTVISTGRMNIKCMDCGTVITCEHQLHEGRLLRTVLTKEQPSEN